MAYNGLAKKRAGFGTRICQSSTEFYYVLYVHFSVSAACFLSLCCAQVFFFISVQVITFVTNQVAFARLVDYASHLCISECNLMPASPLHGRLPYRS